MTFLARQLSITFIEAEQTAQVVQVDQLRAEALILQPGANLSQSRMNMRVWGLPSSVTDRFSTDWTRPLSIKNDQIYVRASNDAGVMEQVFEGTIISATVDYNAAPEPTFDISSIAGFLNQAKGTAVNSYKGAVNVKEIVSALAGLMGFSFEDHGVTAVLSNAYLSGTLMDQLRTVVEASATICTIDNGKVDIWPSDGKKTDTVINLGPTNSLVGYPSFTRSGLLVNSIYRPEISQGRLIALDTSVPRAAGTWQAASVEHHLSCNLPNGPWFTKAHLIPEGYFVTRFT